MLSNIFDKEQLVAGLTLILRLPSFLVFEIWFRSFLQNSSWLQQGMTFLVVITVVLLMIGPSTRIGQVYSFFLCAFPVIFAYSYAVEFSEFKKFENKNLFSMDASKDFGRLILGGMFTDYLFGEKYWTEVFMVAYLLPFFIWQFGLSNDVNYFFHCMANETIFYFLTIKLTHLIAMYLLKEWYNIIDNFGFGVFLNIIASHTRLSKQFLIYWCMLFLYHLFCNVAKPVKEMDWYTLFFVSVGECCTTPLGVIAMCTSLLCGFQYFITLPLIFLHGLDTYGKLSYKVTWTHGFFILAMYIRSGYLPSAENLESPFQGAFRIKIVLLSMVLYFLYITYCNTHAVIISFSRAATTKPIKHIQGLLTYFFIIILCILSMTLIYKISDISETFNILSLCVSTCVQAASSIIVYIIYVYDRMYSRPWESMDDVIFYIWSTIQFINTVLSCVLICIGDFFLFQNFFIWFSPLALAGCLPYWGRLKKLWENLKVRRKVMKMIDLLPVTVEEQMQNFDGVCSICQYSISTAKITPCGHFFHRMCLQKWMYTNELCPVCRQSVSSDSSSESDLNNESVVHSESDLNTEVEEFNESNTHSDSDSEGDSSINSEQNSLYEFETTSDCDSVDEMENQS
ncbi:RING finger protein 145-like [Saccostrea cucullata]|uniref:RING finger protein 145-like n=1 Tax=Saccostrea cuccullata TaxID=36930 RepID=UPI002ED506BA